ncbi:MAG: hypothetical protein AAF624_08970 [Bacteroidota bacterium]
MGQKQLLLLVLTVVLVGLATVVGVSAFNHVAEAMADDVTLGADTSRAIGQVNP